MVGGDGTVNEVVNGVAGTGAEIALLSSGTGEDFGRTHGIPDRFEDAVRTVLDGGTKTIDVGRVECDGSPPRFFANVGSAGMSGSVARRANAMSKVLGGKATFFYALTREFLAWQNTHVAVELDGGVRREGRLHDVIVANGNFHGGGMKLAPDAGQDDGLFDVVTIGDVNKLDFLTTAPKLYSGRYLSHPEGGAAAVFDRGDRGGRAAATRGRRRADRDDARAFRGRAGCAPATGAGCVASPPPPALRLPLSRASLPRERSQASTSGPPTTRCPSQVARQRRRPCSSRPCPSCTPSSIRSAPRSLSS